ncbi:VRR-NUC domain-containing protein (plasmid) [Acinetobacter baumannii]|uniref:VRR-NUC domain-containing protein n=5 Tax=Acinetobacter baumannii TaxID=470 RepID=UPI00234164B7|nr:VRR-NUC domain-containing protein [Acinetobacter baumannii]MDC4678433.1 VRR-NUC domain-containing protein [Acinetobacter baumannii]MDC4682107.1 VRR-NUC domain-containing protein [Acinetobacter baumannii]MDC4689447.1 VRR-NUC domain-containing protein [Acinetobacter baumannii]MDC4721640.1 VRR-NUC domain-containing protein [Acinetobacter baumannii]
MAEQEKPQGKLTTSKLPTIKVVAIGGDQLDPQDKEVICKAICYCNTTPNKGKAGHNQYQSCVSERLKELDRFMGHQSPYKPEVNYDMHKSPPEPIMDKGILTKAHDYLPGWIRKYWEKDKGYPYEAGEGMVRRPDVIIVKDPTKPPTQDNIKQVVEIKFGNDVFSERQKKDYATIAGSEHKVKQLDADECDCGSSKDGNATEVSTAVAWATAIAGTLLYFVSRGKTPRPRFPLPKPAPAW